MGSSSARADIADVVIVGGGTAGCVIAGRLAAESDSEVMVVEAGSENTGTQSTTPGGAFYALDDRILYNDVTVPQTGLSGRTLTLSTGKGLGGGSSVNLLAWFHGHPEDFDGWLAAGAETASGTALSTDISHR